MRIQFFMPWSRLPAIWLIACCVGSLNADNSPADKTPTVVAAIAKKPSSKFKKEIFSGRVVLLREALKRRGVTAYSEFDKQVVLETITGELIPIVPDWRGRAFFQDKRLRNRRVDLVGYRRVGVPYLQVLMVFTLDKNGVRQYTDYWCDICSIPMYEVKPCDCCQGEIRLRFQPGKLPDYISGKNGKKKSAHQAKSAVKEK